MKKLFGSILAIVVVGAVPMLGLADHNDLMTGADCTGSSQGVHLAIPLVHTNEIDRGSGCISDGDSSNGAEAYMGGELNANEGDSTIPNEPFGGPCGGIRILGMGEELNNDEGFPMGGDDWNGNGCK